MSHLKKILLTTLLFFWSTSLLAQVLEDSLILDLNADLGLTLENTNRVVKWENQVLGFPAQDFVINNINRSPGSGRPQLKRNLSAIRGHNSLAFEEQELINFDEDAFDHLTTGSGYTWFAVLAAYDQNTGSTNTLRNVSAFFGNLRNSNIAGGLYEGFWGSFNDDRSVWIGSRNGVTFTRNNSDNPHVFGPVLNKNQFYVIAGRQAAGTGNALLEIFIDSDEAYASKVFPVNVNANPSKMAIGTERDATNHPGKESFDGEIARFLIYERDLSQAEFRQTMASLRETYFGDEPTITGPTTSDARFNFEKADLQGAVVTSGSFGEVLQNRDTYLVNRYNTRFVNKEGDYFLSTIDSVNGGFTDRYTGILKSPQFVLTDPDASLLVGGGSDSNSVYFAVYLESGTEIYRTAKSVNGEPFEQQEFNLSRYVGETIYWQLVDQSTGGWGWISVDDIHFNENPVIDNETTVFNFETGDLQEAEVVNGSFGAILQDRDNFLVNRYNTPLVNKEGNYFLSTIDSANGGFTDRYTGVLRSQQFVLTGADASLLVGGGADSSSVYFAVYLSDGTEIYRTAKTVNGEPFEQQEFSLSSYVGETVYWQLVDQSTGGWGWISVDNIRFE